MSIVNIAGYKFVPLSDLNALQADFMQVCREAELKGTILLSEEGINLGLAGTAAQIAMFKTFLSEDERFNDMTFRESFSASQPFRHLRVKLRKEIITMGRPEIHAEQKRAPAISPLEFKQWLDNDHGITIVDTRNDFEVRFGTFQQAIHFGLDEFGQFPECAEAIPRDKPIVMFCTGGVRCEKAALHLMNEGFTDVYQLEGGILNYFSEVGGAHYEGECFVFDQRVSVDTALRETGTVQCVQCHGPVTVAERGTQEAKNAFCTTCHL